MKRPDVLVILAALQHRAANAKTRNIKKHQETSRNIKKHQETLCH